MNKEEFKYYAFISYKNCSKAAPWAKSITNWANKIHQYLEAWKIPTALPSDLLIKDTDKKITPIFQDSKEMYAGNTVDDTIHEALTQSKTLVVILNKRLIADQEKLLRRGEKPYIYDEIKDMLDMKRPIIIVWIDHATFNKNSRECLPEFLSKLDLKIIEVNKLRKKDWYQLKIRVTAEIAASIFQTNLSAFWDIYTRQRQRTILTVLFLLFTVSIIITWLYKENNINMAFKLKNDAQTEIAQGNRTKASKLAVKAYEKYPKTPGISQLFHECLNSKRPIESYNSPIVVNEKKQIYATIKDYKTINIYDLHHHTLISSFDGYCVSNVNISPNGKLVVGYSPNYLCVYDIEKGNKVMEMSSEYEYNQVDFNTSGTLLLTQRENCNAWTVYEVNSHHKSLYQSVNYSFDKLHWYEEEASFAGSDSLLVVYGKVSNQNIDGCKAPLNAKWKCHIYNLNKRDSIRTYHPSLIKELDIPAETQLIKVCKNQPIILAIGKESAEIITLSKDGKRLTKRTERFGSKLVGFPANLENLPKEYANWNIVNAKMSNNEKFIALIDNTGVLYIIPFFERLDRMNIANGITIEPDGTSHTYHDHKLLGITDSGMPIWITKNDANNSIIYIEEKNKKIEYINSVKPGYSPTKAFQTKDGQFYVNCIKDNHQFTKIPLSVTYHYNKKTDHFIEYYDNSKLNMGGISLTDISTSEKYALLKQRTHKRDSYNYLVYDLKNKENKFALNDITPKEIELFNNGLFIPHYDNYYVAYCMFPLNDPMKEGWKSSGHIVYDIAKKKLLFKNGQFHFYDRTKNIFTFTTQDSIFIYNLEKHKIICKLPSDYEVDTSSSDDYNIVINKLITVDSNCKMQSDKYVINCRDETLSNIPDISKGRFHSISPDGKYLTIINTDTINIYDRTLSKYKFKIKGNDYAEDKIKFTPDSKGLICGANKGHGLMLFDLDRMKMKYHWDIYMDMSYDCQIESYLGISICQNYLAVVSYGLSIIDWHTGKIIKEFDIPLTGHSTLKFSPDEKYLVADNYLIDLEKMIIISNSLPDSKGIVTNKGIIYDDCIYHFYTLEELKEKVSQQDL